MLLAVIVLAAIMTESNGTYADAPAGAAVSVSSPYIPYGTYADGHGSTEYMRVSTNLVSAVASMIDGLWERVALPYGWLPGEYPLHEAARDTKRILSNAINFYGSDWYGSWIRGPIEQTLADGYVYVIWEPSPGGIYTYKTNAVHAGIAGAWIDGEYVGSEGLRYRDGVPVPIAWTSRKADDMFFGAVEPPISKVWSAKLPFLPEDVDDWQIVFPVYSAYEYDPHLFPSNYEDLVAYILDYSRPHIRRWILPDHLSDIWGLDVHNAGLELYADLKKLPVSTNAVMEKVLKVDPGFEYNYPPVETGSYWTVSGPLGNFRLGAFYDYSPSFLGWDNWEEPYPTNYYVEIGYNFDGSNYSLLIYDAPTGEQLFYSYTVADEDADTLYFDGYAAYRTRLYNDADDFKHWRNMTKRLDWKRLGIIAQLERHLETSYRVREREDYLPLWEFYVLAQRNYTGSIPIHIKIEADEIAEAYVVGAKPSRSLAFASWALDGVMSSGYTNRISASYPTARSVVYLGGAGVSTQYSPFRGTFDLRDDVILDGIADEIHRVVTPWPSGVKKIRVDVNFTPIGITAQTIFVWFGPDDVRSFAAAGDPFGYFVVPDGEFEGTFILERQDTKRAQDITTLANDATEEYKIMGRDIPAAYPDEMTPAAVSNLEARLWGDGYIKTITLPTIELRLAASNDHWAAQRDAEPVMPWLGEIGVTNEYLRAFRYQCDVKDAAPLVEFRGDRLLSLRDLDSEVKKFFKVLAGRDITTGLAGRAQFIAAEIAAFNNAIAAAEFHVALRKVVHGRIGWIEADYDFDNGWQTGDSAEFYMVTPSGTNVTHFTYEPTAHPYGEWVVELAGWADPAYTNAGIRVDGHQNQMMKTLWKFKNMRDPNL